MNVRSSLDDLSIDVRKELNIKRECPIDVKGCLKSINNFLASFYPVPEWNAGTGECYGR
ncbi:hypothetical protein Q2T42_20790 [Leptolyngbya boryana CZ1]|uniref:Uncharacterized protein n=1 Tax=Leptolyngbya boryana CZ1 TaxID=3060204 RepID=A0AA96WRI5_LEPBY|nr:hypothetical protein [Leptolyngbya boryana]WNZ44267.1 hypothetical protein Q2T42_20790 [Leptolyngbya boryana CZ1]